MPRAFIVVAVAAAVSCYPSAGTEGGRCYGNNTCDSRLTCLSRLCVRPPSASEGVVALPEVAAVDHVSRPNHAAESAGSAPCPLFLEVMADTPLREAEAVVLEREATTACARPTFHLADDGATSRDVSFRLFPGSAALRVDGREHVPLAVLELPVGSHTVEAFVPDDPCCDRVRVPVCVLSSEPDEPKRPQVISVELPIRPARVLLTGAPAGGTMVCDNHRLHVGSPAMFGMSGIELATSCRLEPSGQLCVVPLHAGRTTRVQWAR